METVNWMYLLDPEGMLKVLELVLLSAAVACTAQYHKDADLSNLPNWQTNKLNLFYVVFIAGLVTVIVLFISFLFNLDKRCGSPRGWRFFDCSVRCCTDFRKKTGIHPRMTAFSGATNMFKQLWYCGPRA